MKLKSILLLSTLAACLQSSAQTWVSDSVTMGAGYANDAYYSFSATGAVSTVPNNTWDLAFHMVPQGGPNSHAGAWANFAGAGTTVYPLHLSATAKFTTLTAADTIGKTTSASILYNSDSSWNIGALNGTTNPADPYNYGWGEYDIVSHNVSGDSLFLIKTGTGTYKFWIQQLIAAPTDSIKWVFRIAKFDGTGDTTIQFYRKNGYTDRLRGYYNIAGNTKLDREPSRSAWDVIFTRYTELTPYGPGVIIPYTVTGVLSNFTTTVARAQHVQPDVAVMSNYPFSAKMNAIGSVWKNFDMTLTPPAYVLVDSNSYFVKSQNSNMYYQLQFTGFTSSLGKIVFGKKTIGTTAVNEVAKASLNAFAIAPNPANNTVSVMVDAKVAAANTRIVISDMSGKTVKIFTVNVNSGMNAYTINTADFATGMYLVNVAASNWNTSGKLTIQH